MREGGRGGEGKEGEKKKKREIWFKKNQIGSNKQGRAQRAETWLGVSSGPAVQGRPSLLTLPFLLLGGLFLLKPSG